MSLVCSLASQCLLSKDFIAPRRYNLNSNERRGESYRKKILFCHFKVAN